MCSTSMTPNTVYDTACSSSLVVLGAAVLALQMGKCDMALAAGANELFDMKLFEAFARAGMLSPTGRCHTWDASADGYVCFNMKTCVAVCNVHHSDIVTFLYSCFLLLQLFTRRGLWGNSSHAYQYSKIRMTFHLTCHLHQVHWHTLILFWLYWST